MKTCHSLKRAQRIEWLLRCPQAEKAARPGAEDPSQNKMAPWPNKNGGVFQQIALVWRSISHFLAPSALDSSIQNLLPLPGSDSNPALPPIRSAALRTMVSPMPVPEYSPPCIR